MIIPITGKVSYSITLDPSVWIFDDRKILLEDAFNPQPKRTNKLGVAEQTAKRLNQAYQQRVRPPVNKSLSKFEREEALKNSYVMPIKEFIDHAKIINDASKATLVTNEEDVELPLDELKNSLFLFSHEGKPLSDNGPVHLLLQDGSNKQTPIKGIKQIIIN